MKPEKTKASWKGIALQLAEEVLYSRNITEQLVGDLPSTMQVVRLATKVTKRGFRP